MKDLIDIIGQEQERASAVKAQTQAYFRNARTYTPTSSIIRFLLRQPYFTAKTRSELELMYKKMRGNAITLSIKEVSKLEDDSPLDTKKLAKKLSKPATHFETLCEEWQQKMDTNVRECHALKEQYSAYRQSRRKQGGKKPDVKKSGWPYKIALFIALSLPAVYTGSRNLVNTPVSQATKKIMPYFDMGILRSSPVRYTYEDYREFIRAKGMYDSRWNPKHDFANKWKKLGNHMAKDLNSGLVWYYGDMYVDDRKVKELNSKGFQGHSDWRIATIEELSSLCDPGIEYFQSNPVGMSRLMWLPGRLFVGKKKNEGFYWNIRSSDTTSDGGYFRMDFRARTAGTTNVNLTAILVRSADG